MAEVIRNKRGRPTDKTPEQRAAAKKAYSAEYYRKRKEELAKAKPVDQDANMLTPEQKLEYRRQYKAEWKRKQREAQKAQAAV